MNLTQHQSPTLPVWRYRLRLRWAACVIAASLAAIAALDCLTATAPVQHLYYLPIIYAAVRFRRAGGIMVALAAVLLYHLNNPHLLSLRYGEADVIQILLFFAVGLVTAKIAGDAARLRYLAGTDDLTSLRNLRSFEVQLARMLAEMRNSPAPLALLVLDLDRLKNLNDVHGHFAGAEAVRAVGHTIARLRPKGAVACRYGGDEFVLALPQANEREALRFAETLRRAVELLAPALAGKQFPAGTLTVSIGISCSDFLPAPISRGRSLGHRKRAARETEEDAFAERLFQMADCALYEAKNGGRNRICVSSRAQTLQQQTVASARSPAKTPHLHQSPVHRKQ
jgi:diguanylate cyclase (GGDEF)-like protein